MCVRVCALVHQTSTNQFNRKNTFCNIKLQNICVCVVGGNERQIEIAYTLERVFSCADLRESS